MQQWKIDRRTVFLPSSLFRLAKVKCFSVRHTLFPLSSSLIISELTSISCKETLYYIPWVFFEFLSEITNYIEILIKLILMIKIIVFMSNALWTPIMWSHVEWLWWTFKGRLRGVYFHRLLCNAKLNLGKINIHELYFDQLFILFVYFEDWGLLSSSIVQFNSLSTDQCYARDKDDGACFCIDWKTSPIF